MNLAHAARGALILPLLVTTARASSQDASASAGDAHRLTFDPAPGTRIGKTIRVEHALETLVLGVGFGGDELKELPRVKLVTTETLIVDDEYRSCANGRPTSLRRVFRDVLHDLRAFAPGVSEPISHLTATSPLRDFSVLFTWVPEERAYGRFYDAREGVEEALPSLGEDLDCRALLPPRRVRVGERWDIEPARLREILSAGGKLPLEWTPTSDDPALRNIATGVGGALSEVFGEATRGQVSAELVAVAREGAEEIAQVDVSIELDTARDQTELIRNRMTRAEVMRGSIVTRAQIAFRLKARAKLSWNLTQGRVHAFELEGVEEIEREIEVGGGAEKGGQIEKASLKGPLKITLAVGPPRADEPAPTGESPPPAPEPGDDGEAGGGD